MTVASVHPVLIVGSVAFDDLQLPTVTATDVIGGSATYCGLATSLFAPVRLVAVVGSDFPKPFLQQLSARHIDVTGITVAPGKTFRWSGRYSENLASRVSLSTDLNVLADFNPVLPLTYTDSPFVVLGNIHPELQLSVLKQVKSTQLVAADTMNFWIEGERESLLRVLSHLDLLVINDEELQLLSGDHNLRRSAASVLRMGPKSLIVKRGEHGSVLFDDHGIFFAPPFPLQSELDPTGAGDSFLGGLIGALSQSWPTDGSKVSPRAVRHALTLASTVASFCVEGVGLEKLLTLNRSTVTDRWNALRSMVQWPE